MEPVEEATTPVQYLTQGTLDIMNELFDDQVRTTITNSAVRMLDIEDFEYDQERNLLTFVDDLPMYIPQQALNEPHPSTTFTNQTLEKEIDHRLDRMIYVRNEGTGNTVTFTYQSLAYTVKALTGRPDKVQCTYVVQPGSLWNSKLHNDKGVPLKLILTYELLEA